MARPNFRSFLTDPQNIIALGVTIISACALIVSIQQTRIMTKQQDLMFEKAKAEVWPHLTLGISMRRNPEDGNLSHFKMSIKSNGVGPAIIKGVRVTYQGEPAKDWKALFDNFEIPDTIPMHGKNSNISGRIVRVGDEFTTLDFLDNSLLAEIYYQACTDIQFEILYASIYGDQWLYTATVGEKDTTEPVAKDFTIPDEEQFDS